VKRHAALIAILAAIAAPLGAPLGAQQTAGYPPDQSPYRELESRQLISVFGGYYSAGKDAVRALPGSAPLIGVRYEITVSGPAHFFVRGARIASDRTSYDPALGQNNRKLGSVSAPLYLADVGFTFNLTGRKSWKSFVPTAGFALGIVNSSAQAANDPYKFGTEFAVSTEFGLRHVTNSPFEWRVSIGNTLYQTRYPNAYYTNGADGTPLLGTGVSKSSYRNNWLLSAGLGVAIFR
jgi:hypothetical protein